MSYTPSTQVRSVLFSAAGTAARPGSAFVGTEDLLIGLAGMNGVGRRTPLKSLRRRAVSRWTDGWADDDGGVGGEADAVVTALLREAHHREGKPVRPESRALRSCLRQALTDAGDGVLTTTHLALALLRQETGRAAELFAAERVDIEALITAVHEATEPEHPHAVDLLRSAGALEGDPGGGFWRWAMRPVVRSGCLGAPVLPMVVGEARRLAASAGRSEAAAIDLVMAVLAIDRQLTGAGLRLRPEYETGGAAALRAAGVDEASLVSVEAVAVDVGEVIEGAKRAAAERGDEVVGTAHLLMTLREGSLAGVLSDLAVET